MHSLDRSAIQIGIPIWICIQIGIPTWVWYSTWNSNSNGDKFGRVWIRRGYKAATHKSKAEAFAIDVRSQSHSLSEIIEAEAGFQMPESWLHEAKAEAGFSISPMSGSHPVNIEKK